MTDDDRQHDDEWPLIAALASGQTVRDAAAAAGVSEATAFRRRRDPAFRQRVEAVRSELFTTALGQLADAATEAVTTLRVLLGDKSATIRLGAARSILELGPRLQAAVELEGRIAAIEAHAVGMNSRGRER